MKLGRIGQQTWTVYAACGDDGSCPLLDFIASLDTKRGAKVLRDLRVYVPTSEPADWVRARFSAALVGSDGIFEFRWPTRGGGTPRVFWFYDEGRVIICSHGLDKKGAMPQPELRLAEQVRRAYLAAKADGRLEILELEDLDPHDPRGSI